MEKLDRVREGGGREGDRNWMEVAAAAPERAAAVFKDEIRVGRSVDRSFVPLLKAALFGNDAKDAYGDECTAASGVRPS